MARAQDPPELRLAALDLPFLDQGRPLGDPRLDPRADGGASRGRARRNPGHAAEGQGQVRHARASSAALLALLALAAGCERKATLVPASADTTHVRSDSFSVYARKATDSWEGGANDEAAG